MKLQFTTAQVPSIVLVAILLSQSVSAQLLTPPQKPLSPKVVAPSEKLLTTDWERDPKIATRSTSTFGAAGNDSAELLLAYTLNRMRHNKTREAISVANELTAKHPKVLDGWMLKAWLNALTNNYDIACTNIRSLKSQLATTQTSPEVQKNIYRRLGRLIGYFQGPVQQHVNEDLLEATILSIAKDLTPDALKVFNDSREATLKRYDALLQEQGTRTQHELAKVQAKNEQEAIGLERQNQILTQTQNQLLAQKEKLREDSTRHISKLQQDGASIEQQLNSVATDIRLTQRNLQAMYTDLYAIQNTPPAFRPPAFYLTNDIRNAELSLASLQASGLGLTNQANAIRVQITQAQNTYNAQARQLDKDIKKASSSQKRNMNKLAKIAEGPKVADGKRNAMQNKATSLRTFDDIPLELYKQQLLEAIK